MKNKQRRELAVCGFAAVRALAEHHPERVQRLFFTQERARFFGPLCKRLAADRKIYRLVEDPQELEKLSQSVHHQGVVAMIAEPEIPRISPETVEDWASRKERVLALDRVGNANNLGAIVRSAGFFGITKIVISEDDDQAELSTSAWRVAEGGMEFVEVWRVSSAPYLAKAAAGRMTRIGADHRARNRLSDFRTLCSDGDGIVVFMGNEESGLSPELKASCDHLVRIPGTGDVESLNVAQAATLFLYEMANL